MLKIKRMFTVVVSLLILTMPGYIWAGEDLDTVLENLHHSDWRIRRDAVRSIGELLHIEGLPYLEMALNDEDSNVQWAAIDAMVKIGSPAVPILVKAVDHTNPSVRAWAVEGIGKIGPEAKEAVGKLITLLEKGNPLQVAAVNVLGKIGANAEEAVPHLALLLGGDFPLAMAARKAITQINPQADPVVILLEALRSDVPDIRLQAASAIGGLGAQARPAIPVLTDMLKHEEAGFREVSARALGNLGSVARETVSSLIELLHDPSDSVKLAAVEALGRVKAEPEITVPALSEMLLDGNPDIKRATLRAIKSFRADAKSAAPYVALAIGDDDPIIRRMSEETLADIAPDSSIVALLASLVADESEILRARAANALGYVEAEQEQAVDLLITALEDASVEVRSAAARSLGNLGDSALKATEDLVKAAQDQECEVGWAAVISLGRIAPEEAGQIIETLGPDHVPVLIEAATHADHNIREPAIAILKEIAAETELVELMVTALAEGDEQMRSRAVKVLHAVGSDVQEAVGALVLALEDKNATIAKEAESALLDLTGERSILAVLADALSHKDLRVQSAARRMVQNEPPIYATLDHDTMTMSIGYPAVVTYDDELPKVKIWSLKDGRCQVLVTVDQEHVIEEIDLSMEAGTRIILELPQKEPMLGTYKIQLKYLSDTELPYYDAFYFIVQDPAIIPENSSKVAYLGRDGRMVYVPDYKGNRLPDFSGVGYMGGGVSLPEVPVKVEVEPGPGDDTARIQAAIDQVSALPLDENGFRGAVLLKAGVYEIANNLHISASGVVLRGEGQGDMHQLWLDPAKRYTLEELKEVLNDKQATVLIATGPSRRKVLQVGGAEARTIDESSETRILDEYVPVGANSFHVANPERFAVGDSIIARRYGNAEWISEIGMDRIPPRSDGGTVVQWSPFHLDYEHVILAIDGNKITIDSSIVNAIERRWGGGSILHYTDNSRISQVGVENLRAISFWMPNADGVDDTRHADTFLDLYNIKHSWVKDVTLEHFYSTDGAIRVGRGSAWITIQDSSTLIADRRFYEGPGYDPSGRTFFETDVYVGRYGFHLQGQSTLIMRCYALNNRHGFTFGSRVTGPNVFLDCVGKQALTWSEPHHRWSTGGLYDNVHDLIALMNRGNMGSGHGWAGANYVAWNTEGTLVAQRPPTAQNWAIGHVGKKDAGGNRGPDGFWDSHGRHVEPRSLYLQQLYDRLGEEALRNIGY